MDEESSTFRLSPDKLARLWRIGSDSGPGPDTADSEQRKATLLRDWLAREMVADRDLVELLGKAFCRSSDDSQFVASDPLRKLLNDPHTPRGLLDRIKDCSKQLIDSAQSEADREVLKVIYYASIASSLLFHGTKITSFSYENLAESFSMLLAYSWLTSDIDLLFKRAHELCLHKAEKGRRAP